MLSLVGTPIGNLDDISYRQAKTLAQAEIILSEDTRTTGLLIQRMKDIFELEFPSNQRIISYYKDKEFEKLPQIIEWLHEEKNIALISQAGMPIISDPGYLLVKTAIKAEIPFEIIPGPSAVITALLYSGMSAEHFCFLGFFPKKESELKKVLGKIQQTKEIFPKMTFIAFESPNRLHKTLEVISNQLPEVEVCVTRELTKKFEEIVRGKAEELAKRDYKGEITLLIS